VHTASCPKGFSWRSLFLRVSFAVVLLVMLVSAVGLGVGLLTYKSYAKGLVPPEQLAVNRPSAGAVILDRGGKTLYRYVDDKDGLRHPITLDQVSPAFLGATIATEDATFYSNPGVNIRGLERAATENIGPFLKGNTLSGTGGSSITQQLVKNLYIAGNERSERSIDRKIRELVFALELTKRYSKDQILTWYVNQISYGGVYSGVESGSQAYFGKPARDLTLAEAALLAGIPQSPAAYDPQNNLEAAMQRRNQVLDLVERRGSVQIGESTYYQPTHEQIEAARNTPVEIHASAFPIEAPHFVLSYVAPQLEALVGKDAMLRGSLVVTTTLDLDLQYIAQANLERLIAQNERASNAHNGAVAIIQPSTGEIVTMLGSRDYFRDDIEGRVNNLLAINSPGSSFKPFVYLASFLNLNWSPGTLIEDTPVSYKESNGTVFSPENPNHQYNGTLSLRNALGNSLNVAAFKVAQQLGVPKIVDFARSMGITSLEGSYGPAIAIGGVDLRALDLTYAYSVLANGGVMAGQDTFAPSRATESTVQPIAILKIESPSGVLFDVNQHRTERRIAPAEYTYLVTDILKDGRAECITFGCGGLNVPGYDIAVKTGTSEPYDPKGVNKGKIGETWAFGYTPDITVGVWAGNSDNSPVVNIFSTTISFAVMKDTIRAAYNGRPQTAFTRPPGVATRSVCVAAPQRQTAESQPGDSPQPQQPQVDPRNPLALFFPQFFGLGPDGQPLPPPQVCTSDLVVTRG
jgi:membrane peptidoglycan carboxypeptidase